MIVTRFAPSPTGRLHVGNLRTALMNWLHARRHGGRFVLRIDDTDAERSEERFVDGIREDLRWLGLDWDDEFRQSDRFATYRAASDRLKAARRLYDCYETPRELEIRRRAQLSRGQPPVYDRAALMLTNARKAELAESNNAHWRFLLDREPVEWDDMIRGPQKIDANSVSDPVLWRADGALLYTLASVVDDIETGVTHVLRGADHVTNTAVQIQIFRALEAAPPAFGHHSLLTGADGEGLSKRLGTLSLADLRDEGVEPAALVSFLARLGSSKPVEVVTDAAGLVESFDPADFGLAPTRFDPAELRQHSARTLRALPLAAVAGRLEALGVPEAAQPDFWAAVVPNLDRLEEAGAWWQLCREGARPAVAEADRDFVAQALALLPPRPWGPETWGAWTAEVKAATGRKGKALFQPLRQALTGRDSGPDMARLMPLLDGPVPQV